MENDGEKNKQLIHSSRSSIFLESWSELSSSRKVIREWFLGLALRKFRYFLGLVFGVIIIRIYYSMINQKSWELLFLYCLIYRYYLMVDLLATIMNCLRSILDNSWRFAIDVIDLEWQRFMGFAHSLVDQMDLWILILITLNNAAIWFEIFQWLELVEERMRNNRSHLVVVDVVIFFSFSLSSSSSSSSFFLSSLSLSFSLLYRLSSSFFFTLMLLSVLICLFLSLCCFVVSTRLDLFRLASLSRSLSLSLSIYLSISISNMSIGASVVDIGLANTSPRFCRRGPAPKLRLCRRDSPVSRLLSWNRTRRIRQLLTAYCRLIVWEMLSFCVQPMCLCVFLYYLCMPSSYIYIFLPCIIVLYFSSVDCLLLP